jgi:transcriptional regulator with XRE-family HTH domain
MRKPRDELLLKALGAEIRARRVALQISQDELAHRAGLNRTFVAKVELAQAQPSLTVLFHLARALGDSPSSLVDAVDARDRKGQAACSSEGQDTAST